MSPTLSSPAAVFHLPGATVTLNSYFPINTSGGFCDVFLGEHSQEGKVALKRPRIVGLAATDKQIQHFLREAEIWQTLSHPNILKFIGVIHETGYVWLASPYAENGSLSNYIELHPESDRIKFMKEVASGLAYLHEREIIHGDIKAANVLVSADVTAQLCDFGLAKMADSRTSSSMQGVGNARWQAPELFEGDLTRTYKTDVYALGMTIAEILTGDVPFAQYPSAFSVISAVLQGHERPRKMPMQSFRGESYEVPWKIAEWCWDDRPEARPSAYAVRDMCTGNWTVQVPERQLAAFSRSSYNIRIDENYNLIAECFKYDRQPNISTLNLNELLGNVNGRFEWGFTDFSATARNPSVQGSVLCADLFTIDGEAVRCAIDLDEHIANMNGVLTPSGVPEREPLWEQQDGVMTQ